MAHILIVDDEIDIRELLARMLQRLGHTTDLAPNAPRAIERVLAHEYDLVITDLRMPGMTGLEFLRAVQHRLDARTPSMIITAFDEVRYAIEATRLGVCNFLVKPFEMQEMGRAIDRALQLREAWTYRRRYEERLEGELREILQRFLEQFVDRLECETEAHDHCRRVADWTLLVARQMGVHDDRRLLDMQMGALLHDIGKVKIPSSILRKTAPLTAEEWRIIRTHPQVGAEMVRNVPRLDRAAVIIEHHHEKYDGSGYPHGLVGEEIPLEARIFSVVDAFDCMIERRCYKDPRLPEDALRELVRHAGRQFDPDVVQAFLKVYPSIQQEVAHNGARVPSYEECRLLLEGMAAQLTGRIGREVREETQLGVHGGNGREKKNGRSGGNGRVEVDDPSSAGASALPVRARRSRRR